jgi:hypothetical protein
MAGHQLVSSESATWLGEHFKVALSQIKPEIDQLFIAGVNHIFYHGTPYSPQRAAWPGWQFYASVQVAPGNPIWRDLKQLNGYITRCQTLLQSTTPANDVLIYFPVHDLWQNPDGLLEQFTVHNLNEWLYGTPFHQVTASLWQQGYTFDYISDRLIQDLQYSDGVISISNNDYKTLIVPECELIPLSTVEHLITMAESGANVIFSGSVPEDIPGLTDLNERRKKLRQLYNRAGVEPTGVSGDQELSIKKGRIIITRDVSQTLQTNGIIPEEMAKKDLHFIRKKFPDGYCYFVSNLGAEAVRSWITLAVAAKSIRIVDPMHKHTGLAAIRIPAPNTTAIYLELKPGESRFLLTSDSVQQGTAWPYLAESQAPVMLNGDWTIDFLEGGPELPETATVARPVPWTELDDARAAVFAGTARYSSSFDLPETTADDWLLDLGNVAESARVYINGGYAGTLVSHPFEIRVGEFLRSGNNQIAVEVTNLAANRIADSDRKGVRWKIFHDINFVNINYKPFDASGWPVMTSGLPGHVRLIPLALQDIEGQ